MRRLIKYNKEGYARIGIMPRYGEADSLKWFNVEPSCTFHIINCYEEDDEVVVMACRALDSIIPGPDFGLNKLDWFSKGFKKIHEEAEDSPFLSRVYEWRLDMVTGEVTERNLTGSDYSMEFPMINHKYSSKKCKCGYTQVLSPMESSTSGSFYVLKTSISYSSYHVMICIYCVLGMAKYGGLAKLHLQERKLKLSAVCSPSLTYYTS